MDPAEAVVATITRCGGIADAGTLIRLAADQHRRTHGRPRPSIRTWNARSNEPMLRVNQEIGFVVTGYLHEWQKQLGWRAIALPT